MSIEEDQARFLKCIGEPTRLRILNLLVDGEKSVGEIVDAVEKEQSLVSHHLKALKECNILLTRQKAQKIYYKLADPKLVTLILQSESLTKELLLCRTQESCDE